MTKMTETIPADPNGSVNKIPDTTIRNPNRRSNKPIMEKRRRARINNCLNELKAILLEAMRKDPARHSKLEKADILELTVSHLKALHRAGDSTGEISSQRFRAGFAAAAAEVGRFLSQIKPECADPGTSHRLINHLADCLNNPILLNGNNNDHRHDQPPSSTIISLVPSRLSSGEIAFVFPQSSGLPGGGSNGRISSVNPLQMMQCNPLPPVPMLSPEVPLELTVSSSNSSAGSDSGSSSMSISPNYPVGSHNPYTSNLHNGYSYSKQQHTPLSLVTPKREIEDQRQSPNHKIFRPW